MTTRYVRPIPLVDPAPGAHRLAGGWSRFSEVDLMGRGRAPERVPADDLPADVLHRLTAPRPDLAALSLDAPRLMGILNTTPDSFSDGGKFLSHENAVAQSNSMIAQGADIIDIGGESTRPGAKTVSVEEEIARTSPVIASLRGSGIRTPISIDTRKSAVARAAIGAGANMVNDVSALQFDPGLMEVVAQADVPVCLMHAQGSPETMQDDPRYSDVLFDVYDALEERVLTCEKNGIKREKILIDPGIGFGKTLTHNLTLLRNLSMFHGLGCPILLGASRKRFIGTLSGTDDAAVRMPGSVAVALHGLSQGVQVVRVHDVEETRQAFRIWQALTVGTEQV